MNKMCLKTADKDKAILDQNVTLFFYAANIPFNGANLEQYKVMFKILRLGHKPLSDKDFENKLLDNALQKK